MKTIKVTIKGITPLLMNNPISMIEDASKGKVVKKTKEYDIYKDADKLAYKMKDGTLYIPSEAIKGTIVNASAYKKFGKYSARPIIAGGVHINPNQVSLKTKKYDYDIRTVVIQRARVVKARPMIKNWKAEFEIMFDDELIQHDELIKPILEEAGKRVGLLDFRPQKLGSFGMFEIEKWETQ